MKKIVASVGLVALGASGIQTTSAQVLGTPDATKPWSLGVTLRGFYDDNTATVPDNTTLPPGEKKQSFGYEVSPSAAVLWSVEQTTLSLGFLYSLKYYENRPPGSTGSHADQAFTFPAGLDHTFSERFKARVNDSFVIGQEPDLLRAGNTLYTFQRVSGDNIRNYGSIGADAQITPKIGVGAGSDNSFYDYNDTATGSYAGKGIETDSAGNVIGTTAGVLNLIQNRIHLEGLYQILPETKALIGYQFTDNDYNGGEWIGGNVVVDQIATLFGAAPGSTLIASDTRNSRENTGYLGLIHNFSPQLSGSIRAGASYTEYYNDPSAGSQTTPYVNLNLRYTYAPQSYVEGGFSYDRNPTDVVGVPTGTGGTSFTLDAESATFYATVHHRITGELFGSVIGQYQSSTYNGGAADGKTDNFFLVGLELEYRLNPFVSCHAGYNFDRLDSDLPDRSFSRNRVYIGVTASY